MTYPSPPDNMVNRQDGKNATEQLPSLDPPPRLKSKCCTDTYKKSSALQSNVNGALKISPGHEDV